MRKQDSGFVVIAAIIANLVIMASKYAAALFTGSSAMVSEAIHSTVDSLDGFFLLIGKKRSRKPADELHPFGHGKALYFWSFIVSVFIFAAGGGMSVYEGITHLANPHLMRNVTWNYVVLGIAFVSESISFSFALRDVRAHQRGRSLWQTIRHSKDPTSVTVLLEDSAALTGLLFAFLGVFLGHALKLPVLDGIASLLIGLVLFATALILARESRDLLVGESMAPDRLIELRARIEQTPGITQVRDLLTMHLSPEEILLTLKVAFRPELEARKRLLILDSLEQSLRKEFPDLKQVYIGAVPMQARRLPDSKMSA